MSPSVNFYISVLVVRDTKSTTKHTFDSVNGLNTTLMLGWWNNSNARRHHVRDVKPLHVFKETSRCVPVSFVATEPGVINQEKISIDPNQPDRKHSVVTR